MHRVQKELRGRNVGTVIGEKMDGQIGMFDDLEQYEIPENRLYSCFFTGHRSVPAEIRRELLPKMKNTVAYLYSKGVKEFHTGGALGFDTLAATQVLDMRRDRPDMKLILDLPFRNQAFRWSEGDRRIYEFLLKNADGVNYVFDGEVAGSAQARKYLLMRNRIMANSSHYCVAYWSGNKISGTGYTVKYADSIGCEIINLFGREDETV